MIEKQCRDCGQINTNFHKDARHKDGLVSYCKKCAYIRSQYSKKKNWAHYARYMREYQRKRRNSLKSDDVGVFVRSLLDRYKNAKLSK